MTKQRLISLLVTATLVVVALFASCVPTSSVADDTVSVYFGNLTAKGINDNVYTVTPSGEITESKVDGLTVDTLYWSYKAVKADDNFKDGETAGMTGAVNGYMPVTDGTGLNKTIEGLAKGNWNFYLQAFTSADDRANGTPVIYSGEALDQELLEDKSVAITTNYVYNPDGKGKVNFSIDVNIEQTLPEDENTEINYYEVTAVKAYAGELSVGLTGSKKSSSDDAQYTGTWTGSIENVPYSLAATKYEIYVDGENTPRATISGNSVVMTNLETNVKGTATITLATGTVSVSFCSSSIPENQPLTKGDTITLGAKDDVGVVWNVLDVDYTNKRALLVSNDILEKRIFDDDTCAYLDSDIQNYIRSDGFFTTYGLSTDYMEKVDVTSTIETTQISEEGSDYVFLLSETEASNTDYFSDDTKRVANFEGEASTWWLRTTTPRVIYGVASTGEIGSTRCPSFEFGLRPAFWYTWK